MIILDGYKLEHFGLVCESQTNPSTPTFENKTLSIPGRPGLYNFGTEIKEKTFEFQVGTLDKNKTLLQYKLREFTSFLLNEYGEPREVKLSYEYEPDVYYNAFLSAQINPERVLRTGKFTLMMVAYDPYAYSIVYSDEILWGNNVITFQSHYKLGHNGSDGLKAINSPTALNIYNDGLVNKPVIEISGSATNLVISANGYSINLGTFTNAEWLIDCDKYLVLKNGANAFGSVMLREFMLLQGNNQVNISGSNINIAVRIKHRDKYI